LFEWSASLKKGVLFIFRPDSPDASQTVKLKGLEQGKQYAVWSEDGSVTGGKRSGAELMTEGLRIALRDAYSCDIIMLQEGTAPALDAPGSFELGKADVSSDSFSATAKLSWTPSAGARSYRVVLTDGGQSKRPVREFRFARTEATVAGLEPGKSYVWSVEARGWGGSTKADTGGAFVTPAAREHPGVVFVSDMPWAKATAGAGNTVRRDTNLYGKTVMVGGRACPKAVWTHAFDDATPADTVIDIAGKGFETFAADAGLDAASGGGSVQFLVLVDGVERARSDVLQPGQVQAFRVDIKGAREVTLRVLNGGDGYACDHAAWGMARFVAGGAEDPFK
jgi:hypothetical protein